MVILGVALTAVVCKPMFALCGSVYTVAGAAVCVAWITYAKVGLAWVLPLLLLLPLWLLLGSAAGAGSPLLLPVRERVVAPAPRMRCTLCRAMCCTDASYRFVPPRADV